MKNLLIFLIISIGFVSFSQNTNKHYLGFHAGSTSSFGPSYRYWPKKLGIETTLLPLILQNNSNKSLNVILGVTGLYMLKDNTKADLYAYLSNAIDFNSSKYTGNNQEPISTTSTNYSLGTGLGIKIDFLKDMDFNLQFGYGFYNITAPNGWSTNFTGEIGLYYHL